MHSDDAASSFAGKVRALLNLSGPSPDPKARMREAVAVLAELYVLALRLPDAQPVSAAAPQTLFPPARFEFIGRRSYLRHGNPDAAGSEETGDLGEDFEDILGELTKGLAYFETRTEEGRQLAIAHWLVTFRHWGHHCVEALRVMHYRVFGNP